ncbi:MAG: TMEM165/GDT1 family protein [Acidimicrobiaceae bacterium]|nr:TMEM165/GDT1 family protein [Acidimicrobiaceae bacterium]MDE0666174.1 TMEM165/GDT1 family protein [Acidimicrobiaceae bacterium]
MVDLLGAFGIVFVAELGDKTQLAAAGFATRYRASTVAAGMCAGYVAVSTFSALVGVAAGTALPTRAINVTAGLLFIIVGLVALRPAARSQHSDGSPTSPRGRGATLSRRGAFAVAASIAGAIVVAELGDKTMLATVALAARNDAVMVWIGATLGICTAGLLAVLLGRAMAARLPDRVIRRVGGAVFIGAGVAVLAVALS